jgi:RNA polymerase sigma factor for flagellar operon FliA
MGLFDAVTKYDHSKNGAFHAYAEHRIKGAVLDSPREMDWASRDLRRRLKQVESVTREMTGWLGRAPERK